MNNRLAGLLCLGLLLADCSGGGGVVSSVKAAAAHHGFRASGIASAGITTLSFVAHMDDDLLFMNPDIAYDIQSGDTVWVVYLTASEDSAVEMPDMTYVGERIAGERAAYAQAAGVANSWTYVPVQFGSHTLATDVLNGTNVHLVFMYMHAAGHVDGQPTMLDGCGDLYRLLHDPSFVGYPINGSPSYTEAGFVSTLSAIIQAVQPKFIRTEDVNGFAQGVEDNIDHSSTAILATAADLDTSGNTLVDRFEYLGYLNETVGTVSPAYDPDVGMAPNLDPTGVALKKTIWSYYWPNDKAMSTSYTTANPPWQNIMSQQYDTYHRSGSPWSPPTNFVNIAPCSTQTAVAGYPQSYPDTNPLIVPIP